MPKPVTHTMRDELGKLAPRLWRYAMVLAAGNRPDADDLVQAAMLRALEKSDQFTPGTRLDSWCFTILSSVWKNELRSRAVRRGQGVVPVEDADLLAPDHKDVNIAAREVLSHMTNLPEAMRETMYLVYVEGHSYAEAAVLLGIPVGTVMSRLANGRRRLNSLMADK